jgi:hypothetical protein
VVGKEGCIEGGLRRGLCCITLLMHVRCRKFCAPDSPASSDGKRL